MKVWQDRVQERLMEGGADYHKQWLVRYYGRLC